MNTKYTYRFVGTLLLAGALLASCSKSSDSLKPQTVQGEPQAFTLKINANNADTKALIDYGQTLGSEWKKGDSLSVYNVTSDEKIGGWLYAQADGFNTTFEGTVSGNFNQGDQLRLSFLSGDYMMQDGTLESIAASNDFAVAVVDVTAIDPEAKTITTGVANFEKQQAVVKFMLTNRKSPVEPLKVTSFSGFGKLPGSEIPFGIIIKPAVATDTLYVSIPYFPKMEITFEATGEDGYDYRLVVPDVNFEEGLYYRRVLNMKRKALLKDPVAKTGLSYIGSAQALVDSAHVYRKVNGVETILDDETDKDGAKCEVSYFVKKEETAGVVPTAPTAAENGWLAQIPTQTHVGTYYVWTKMSGNYDYEDVGILDDYVKVEIAKGTPTLTGLVPNQLTYTGQPQTLMFNPGTVKVGDVALTSATKYYSLDGVSWTTAGLLKAKDQGTYTIHYKIVGTDDLEEVIDVWPATASISKGQQNISGIPSAVSISTKGGSTYFTVINSAGTVPSISQTDKQGAAVQTAAYSVVYDSNTKKITVTHILNSGYFPGRLVTLTFPETNEYAKTVKTFTIN